MANKAPEVKLPSSNPQDLINAMKTDRVVDLCGRMIETDSRILKLAPPSRCTIKNGTLKLTGGTQVSVSAESVGLEDVTIRASGQRPPVEVVSNGSLRMERCRVEGCLKDETAAVCVTSAGTRSHPQALIAMACTLQNSDGTGLVVCDKGNAFLSRCSISNNGKRAAKVTEGARLGLKECNASNNQFGVLVDGAGSALFAVRSSMDRNVIGGNLQVLNSAHAHVDHCSTNGSTKGDGLLAKGASITATHSTSSSNCGYGAIAENESIIILNEGCVCSGNGVGWGVKKSGSCIIAKSKCASVGNKVANAIVFPPARVICVGECDLGGQAVKKKK